MPLVPVGGSPQFETDALGNDYLRFQGVPPADTGGARLPIKGTKFEELHGSSVVTLVAKYTVDHCQDNDHRIFGFSNGGFNSLHGMLVIRESEGVETCLLYTSPSPRDRQKSRMPSSA